MEIPKKYFHDRLVLLLLSASTFAVLLNAALISLHLDSSRSGIYITVCRYCNSEIPKNQSGSGAAFFGFIAFGILVLLLNNFLAMRIYTTHRQYAVTILSGGLLLIVLSLVVSNALLVLR